MIRNLMICAAAALALSASAIPAKRGVRTFTQPDGTQIHLTLVGDENGHFYLTEDQQVVLASEGAFYFAEMDAAGHARPSSMLASDPSQRTLQQTSFLSGVNPTEIKREIGNRRLRRPDIAPAATSGTGVGLFPGSSFPVRGAVKGLVILVNYQDVKFTISSPQTFYTDMLNKQGFSQYSATGSARDYFVDNSCGVFTPEFDVYGPVTLANNRSYYGANDSYENDKLPEEMIIESCKLLDSTVDFSEYDVDKDGYVDNVYVFYAGTGEASGGPTTSVWPHQWELSQCGKSFKLDGVTIDRYACSNELEGTTPDGIGTFVHEFSHVLGLPDLYCTDYGSAEKLTPGEWSVLDMGPYNNDGRTPPSYSVFERNALGWLEPRVIDSPTSITLEEIQKSNDGCIIPTSKDTEFFLLENRQQTGWDKYVPGHGMLIWHIDYNESKWTNNEVNNSSSHQYVDIEEAGGSANNTNSATMAKYPFPGTSYKTEFTDDTKPSMKTWSGASLGLPLTEIDETAGVITFNVAGGTRIEAPTLNEAHNVTSSSFTVSWNEVEGAADYLLTVASYSEGIKDSDYCGFGSNANLAYNDGWTTNLSSTSYYATSGNYGQEKPSVKLANDGAYICTSVYPGDITSISFWAKGQNQTTNPLMIYSVDNGLETLIAEMTDWNKSAGQTYTLSDIPTGVRQIKIMYNKAGSGNLALDDLTIEYGDGGSEVLPDYNEVSTGGNTSVIVNRLMEGITTYTFSVKAVDADGVCSKASAWKFVELSDNILGDINGDGTVDIADITALVESIVNGTVSDSPGDINGDGTVDITDITALVEIIIQ